MAHAGSLGDTSDRIGQLLLSSLSIRDIHQLYDWKMLKEQGVDEGGARSSRRRM